MAKYLLNIVDQIPLVGHFKGFIHRRNGDKEAADYASFAATRTTAVLATGAGAFLLGGPIAAALCGLFVGLQWDLGAILPSHGQHVKGIPKVIEDPKNLNAWIDGTVRVAGDGIAAVCGGKMGEIAQVTQLFAVKPKEDTLLKKIPKVLVKKSKTGDNLNLPSMGNPNLTESLARID